MHSQLTNSINKKLEEFYNKRCLGAKHSPISPLPLLERNLLFQVSKRYIQVFSEIMISWAIFTAMDHANLGVQITNNHCHEVVIIFVDVCSMHQELCILMACAYTNRMSPAGTNRNAAFGSEATKF